MLACVVALGATASPSNSQDGAWAPGFYGPGVANRFSDPGNVCALLNWQGELIVGGDFMFAGPHVANHIAAWNGSAWRTLGEGFQSSIFPNSRRGHVSSLCIYEGELVAAGSFEHAGEEDLNGIARWDGGRWRAIGSGFDGWVASLAVHDGLLVATGAFRRAGGVVTPHLAAWDGAAWKPLISDLVNESQFVEYDRSWHDEDPQILALASYDGLLYIAGRFTRVDGTPARNIAAWDGRRWLAVGGGTDGSISTLHVHDQQLYAGGTFRTAGSTPSPAIARWDGRAWSRVGHGGVSGLGSVTDLTTHDGQLAAIVWRDGFSSLRAGAVWFWDGTRWSRSLPFEGRLQTVRLIHSYAGRLVVGGATRAVAESWFGSLATWDGHAWEPLTRGTGLAANTTVSGINDWIGIVNPGEVSVEVVGEFQGNLVVAGVFDWAGSERVRNIALWNGQEWLNLNNGIEGIVFAVRAFEGDLVVAGRFESAGGVPARNVAAWDGRRWRALGDGLVSTVRGLVTHGGDLVAVGDFHGSGLDDPHGAARWDGTRWSKLGSGLFWQPRTVSSIDGELIVTGSFRLSGQTKSLAIARWGGNDWEPLDRVSGDPSVWQVQSFQHGILALGGDGFHFWDGGSWSRWETGPPFPVYRFTVHKQQVFAAGSTTDSERRVTFHAARWSPAGWEHIPAPDHVIRAFQSHDGTLFVGGKFSRVGRFQATGLARWDTPQTLTRTEPEAPGGLSFGFVATTTRDGAIVRFALDVQRSVQLAVYDVRGRLIRQLVNGPRDSGAHFVDWDGRNRRGLRAGQGVYFVVLRSDRARHVKKVVVVR